MHIRLNIKPNPGACAYVYAWSDDKPIMGVYKFWHNQRGESLRYHPMPISYDDDLYINFESKVPLDEWEAKVKGSEFNDPKRYRFLTHNCAHAAAFALEAAGIKLFLRRPYMFLNRPYDFSLFRIPLCTLSPYDLFYHAKAQKIKELKNSNAEMQYRCTELRIKLWCNFNPTRQTQLVTKITDEIDKRHKKHPEHTEAQIDVLLKTLQLVKYLPSDDECNAYIKSANQFKKRTATKAGQQRNLLIILFCASAGVIGGALFDIAAAYFNKNSLTPKQNLGLLFPSALTLFKLPSKIRSLMPSPGSTVQPTKLSESMKELTSLRRGRT